MKPDLVFILDNASWPALLLDGAGAIVRANPAAVKTFGTVLQGETPLLSAIWSGENGLTPEQFLAHWDHSPTGTMALKFLIKDGGVGVFSIRICSFIHDDLKYYVFQVAQATTAGDAKGQSPEAILAQKQKLD